MNPINETVSNALQTVTQARSTQAATHTSSIILGELSQRLKFDTFGDPQLERMLFAAGEWLKAVERSGHPRWITFLGASGCGKTHLARKLWKIARRTFDWQYCAYPEHEVYWPTFIQQLKSGKAYELRSDMQKWPLLFLDDIGAERDASGFSSDELNALAGARMGKWTILTANLDFTAIKAIDERIASRIVRDNNIVVQVNTKDYSLRPKPKPAEIISPNEPPQPMRTVAELVANMRREVNL